MDTCIAIAPAAITIRAPVLAEIARRWGEIEPVLERATTRTDGCFEAIDVLGLAMSGSLLVWLIEDGVELIAVAVTEVRQYPRKRVCDIPFIAAARHHQHRLAEWIIPLRDRLKAHAEKFGCQQLRALGRPGWARIPGLGMKLQAIMELET